MVPAYPEGVNFTEIEVLHYKYAVVVVIGPADDVVKVLKSLRHDNQSNLDFAATCFADSYGVTFTEHLKWPVVALPSIPRTPQQIGTLAHEVVHAIDFIFHEVNATSVEFGKEIYCQLIGKVVEEVMRWSRTLSRKATKSQPKKDAVD